jgi:hypothetical protein
MIARKFIGASQRSLFGLHVEVSCMRYITGVLEYITEFKVETSRTNH